ncbi:uncharacterized protein FIBRA_01301 [Fibroporia radiculosa]|uniref:tripeptidyl-peptidase II n=1 Tax=Fibroporia radiculosa TaxID=599839 RepID=J4GJT5_9APHY|nr:uncharacterized protein FIBRA_01301 [Fibroporia radiculosa]CCL99285.1 predicted protein [Fibroporia radiculosa]
MAFASSAAAFGIKPAGTSTFGQSNTANTQNPLFGGSQPANTTFGALGSQPQNQNQSQGTSLFGAPLGQNQNQQQQSQPTQGNPLFGNGSMFGQTQQPQQTQSTSLFGQPSSNTQQPVASSGLFGQSTTNSQQQAPGASLFGQPSTNTQQKSTFGSSLFGNTQAQQTNSGQQQGGAGGLGAFGGNTNTGSTLGQTSAAGSTGFGNWGSGTSNPLLGQPTQAAGGLGASTFGSSATGSGSIFGRPAPQQQQQQSFVGNQSGGPPPFTRLTKFNDLPDEIKKTLENVDALIQGRIQISNDLKQRKVGQEAVKGQDGVRSVHKDLVSAITTLHSDVLHTRDLKIKVDQTVQDTIVATRLVDGFRNPQQHGAYLKNYADFPLEFFARVTEQMKERLRWYQKTIEQIERKLSSAAAQSQFTPQAITSTLEAQHATFIALASKTAALDAELQKIKTLYTQLWRAKTGSMRDPFFDLDRGSVGDFGLDSISGNGGCVSTRPPDQEQGWHHEGPLPFNPSTSTLAPSLPLSDMWLSSAWLLLVLGSRALAAPAGECKSKLKESVSPPRGWTKVRPAPADHTIELRIGLPQSNFRELETHLDEISDPLHERYGAHLSKEEVEDLIAPPSDSLRLVDEWLASSGIFEDQLSRSSAKDWIIVKVPVSLAETMLETEYHVWTHEASRESIIRTTSYSLPEHLHDHIDLVQPTTLFSRFRKMETTYRFIQEVPAAQDTTPGYIPVPSAYNGEVDASCNGTITPTCLKQLYNAVGYEPSATGGNHIAVTGYLEQYANYEDFHMFNEALVPAATGSSFNVVYINGGQNNQTPSAAGVEADLDTQYAFGLTYPTPRTFYTTGGSPPFQPDDLEPTDSNEPYANWLAYVLNSTDLPQTISTSYGDDEQTVPYSYAERVCAEFAQLGARGVSIMFSSGDGGVGDGDPDPATQLCYSNDGLNVTKFIPGFPASCPYVTAVGGTIYVPEVAFNISGGGFSDYFPRPSYQDAAVSAFLEKLAPGTYEGLYNPNGRAYPDVSAQSNFFEFFWDEAEYLVGGTSASSPTFAAIISLLNDARLANGLSPLGFLNPLLYQLGASTPSAFNDITVGNNPGCGTEGFNATIGWDAVTGWGTPNFGVLKEIVLGNL